MGLTKLAEQFGTIPRYAFEGEWWKNDSIKSGQELAGCHGAPRNSIEVGEPIWVE